MSLIGFKAKNHRQQVAAHGADDGVDERVTPDSIFKPIDAVYKFTLDAAASHANAKCDLYYTLLENGLRCSWANERVWSKYGARGRARSRNVHIRKGF